MDWSNSQNAKKNQTNNMDMHSESRRRKKKIKKLPFKIKWQRFINKNPHFFKYFVIVFFCVIGTLSLLTILFFIDLYKIDLSVIK